MAFTSFSFVFAFIKDVALKTDCLTTAFITFEEKMSLSETKRIIERLQNEKISGYFYIELDVGLTAYDNKIFDCNKPFSGDKKELRLPIAESAGYNIGTEILINGDIYTFVGNSEQFVFFNYFSFDDEYFTNGIMIEHKKLFSQKDREKINKIMTEFSTTCTMPAEVNIYKKMVDHHMFKISMAIIAVILLTIIIISYFAVDMRKKLFLLLGDLNYHKVKSLILLLLEQLIVYIPMFFVGLGIYYVCYSFFKNMLALLTFFDVLLVFSFFLVLTTAISSLSLLIVRREKNV